MKELTLPKGKMQKKEVEMEKVTKRCQRKEHCSQKVPLKRTTGPVHTGKTSGAHVTSSVLWKQVQAQHVHLRKAEHQGEYTISYLHEIHFKLKIILLGFLT